MAGFSKMIDMAKEPEEVKEEIDNFSNGPKASVPLYDYGLCISFNEDTLQKLGLGDDDMPEVGDMIHLAAMAKVTSVSDREDEQADGTKKRCRRVELCITHLATENEDDEAEGARRQRFYGSDDKAA